MFISLVGIELKIGSVFFRGCAGAWKDLEKSNYKSGYTVPWLVVDPLVTQFEPLVSRKEMTVTRAEFRPTLASGLEVHVIECLRQPALEDELLRSS